MKKIQYYQTIPCNLYLRVINELPRIVSLTIPTDTRAAFACAIKSLIVSGLSDEHPGGTTGRES